MANPNEQPILGIGNDIIEIERIRHSIERYGKRFLDRLFSSKEQAYCLKYRDSATHFAGRFAAKEAIAKALGTGFGPELAWKDIEVLVDKEGKPCVFFSSDSQKRLGSPILLLSISHCKLYATAVAIQLKRK